MKKQVLYTLATASLFSAILLSTMVKADETIDDSTTSTAKITFDGTNTDPVTPVNPNDPDTPVDPNNPIDPDDPDNHGTGDNGPLSIDYVSNITFGTKDIATTGQVYHAVNASPYVQVTDKRGVEGGWVLTASALSFKNGEAATNSDNISKKPVTNDVVFANTEAQTVMTADSLAGEGTWVDVFNGTQGDNANVQLAVPSGSAQAKEYTATITWTLTAGPTE